MKYTISLLLASALCWSHGVQAKSNTRDQFDYFAVSLNKPSYDQLDFTPNLEATDLEPLKEEVEKEKFGTRLFYGYQFNRFFAVEAGFNYFGKSSFKLYTETTSAQNVVTKKTQHKGSFSSLGADVRLIGTLPLTNNLYLKGSVGALAWSSDKEFITKGTDEFVINEESESGVSMVSGLSLAYGIRKSVAVSLDYEKTEIAGIDTSNIGLSVTFRL